MQLHAIRFIKSFIIYMLVAASGLLVSPLFGGNMNIHFWESPLNLLTSMAICALAALVVPLTD